MAKTKKIPAFNDSFDVSKLWLVVKKNIWAYILIIIAAFVVAKLYIRYTIPMYETYSVIQINSEESERPKIIDPDNTFGSSSMTNLIELIRSSEFLKRTLQQLNLYTSYFAEGRFVTSELYKRSPFFVELGNVQGSIQNKKVYVSYSPETQKVTVSYDINSENTYSVEINRNEWTDINGCRIYVNIISPDSFQGNNTQYYFVTYDEKTVYETQFKTLQVSILNSAANTIQVKYTSCNSQKASEIVNTICENFLAYNVEKKQERAEKILTFINEQLDIVYEQLTDSEEQLENFKKENKITGNILDNTGHETYPTQQLEKYRSQLQTLNRVNRQIDNGEDFDIMSAISTLSGTSSESMILNFLNGIQQLQKQKEQLLMTLTPDNHKIKVIDQQIEEQKKHLSDIIDITNKKIQNDIRTLETLAQKPDVSFNETELTKLKRIHDVHQKFYNQLVEKRAEYLISKAGYVTNNLILQKSTEPNSPISPIPSYVVFVAIVSSIAIILMLTVVCYLLFNQITTINDITNYTNAPISGVIPVSNNSDKVHRFVVENKADSVITEAFRTLRSNLAFLHSDSKDEKKIIAVTSTISGEGKTFIAINLGGVFALNGKKVILLDLDLRKPKVHLSFNAHNKTGMSTILIGQDSYKDCIIKTEFETFDIIPSGPKPPNPAELANSKAFDDLLEELKTIYDIIIIDTPPIGIVSDAFYSFQRADLPIYVSRANYSKRAFINNINYLYSQESIKNLSVILNGVSIVSSKYGYGYSGYGYGYSGYGYGYGFGYGYYSYEQKSSKKHRFLGKTNR